MRVGVFRMEENFFSGTYFHNLAKVENGNAVRDIAYHGEVMGNKGNIWGLVVITPFVSMLAFQLDGIFIGATLAKEMRNCMILSSIIFCFILEIVFQNSLDLQKLYSCFLFFLILRGLFLTMYLNRVFKLVRN